MSEAPPIPMRWEGDGFKPLPRFAAECDKHFVVGEVYRLAVVEDRSKRSHDHFFACVDDAWGNLPERWAVRFPSPDHLRKWALIKAGYADSRQYVCASEDDAWKLGAFIRPLNGYAVVTVDGCVLTVWEAQTQSMKAMKKARFQESKVAVLDIIAGMIGVPAATLAANAGYAS